MSTTLYDVSSLLPSSTQTIFFDWISIVYIVILVLGLIIGAKKGFFQMMLSLLGVIFCFVAAYFLAAPVASWAKSTFEWDDTLINSIYDWFLSKSSAASQVLNRSDAELAMPTLVGALGVPGVFQSYVSSFALSSIPEAGATLPVGIYIAEGLSNIAFTVASFLAVFIAAAIVLAILKHFAKELTKHNLIGSLDKFVGAAIGLVIAASVVVLVSYGLTFLSVIGSASTYITNTLRLEDDSYWSFAKVIYENNFFTLLTEQISSLANSFAVI
ncbi:MAG: CvpA family protein [Bacilli bacterium]